jgi:non-specific serine/threonine protein kinase/serine/threonine-protein kinase
MTAEFWAKVRALVESAMLVPPAKRSAFLAAQELDAAVRAEAEELLRFDRQANELFALENQPVNFSASIADASLAGHVIGHYRPVEEIGRGGMGTVYLAERADGAYEQRVALKVLQNSVSTPRLVERFEEERQILARLSHPGIARLLDGGLTPDGRPYLVLEYVDGRAIDVYCDEERLDTQARLRLFLKVADAVQSAHQQLVLHLDLKPANILVTPEGEPRLLDFGIARILIEGALGSNQAEATLRLMTPRYASPEQAEGLPLGVASDVFSLGTLLYRLLTGKLPYRIESASPLEAARIIREEAPLLPSKAVDGSVATELREDLDNILLQALRKEPERRYGTVAAFAEDIKRYLAFEPVQAHPDSLGYRAKKFARRNRGYLAAAAVVLLIVTACVAAVTRAAVLARRADALAERRLADERELAHSYIFDLDPMLEEIPGTVPVRVFILKHALKYLNAMSQEGLGDDDLAQDVASGYLRVGHVQADVAVPSMNDRAGAWKSMNRAHAIQQGLVDKHPGDLARRGVLLRTTFLMSFLATDDGDIGNADKLAMQAWDLGQPIIEAGPKSPKYSTMISVAWELANNRGGNGGEWNFADPLTALPWLDKMHGLTISYKDSLQGKAPSGTAPGDYLERESIARAGVYLQLGRNEDARGQFQEALRLSRSDTSPTLVESEVQMVIRYNFADFLLSTHEVKAAEAMAPPLPLPVSLSDSNRTEISQRADMLGQRARINLRTGRLGAGRHMMDESLNSFEALYRGDPNDVTSLGELAYTSFDLAEEPALDPVTRKRLYLRVIEVTNLFERNHPEALSATMLIAKANLGLAELTKTSTGLERRSIYGRQAADGFSRILAAHPSQPEASRLLAHALALLKSGTPIRG